MVKMPGAAVTTGTQSTGDVSAIHNDADGRRLSWRQAAWRERVDLSGAGVEQRCWLAVEQQLRIRRIESGAEDRDDFAGRDGPGREARRIDNGDRRGFGGSRGTASNSGCDCCPSRRPREFHWRRSRCRRARSIARPVRGCHRPKIRPCLCPQSLSTRLMVLSWRMTLAPVSAIISVPSDAKAMPPGEVSPLISELAVPSDATFQIWLASAT